MIWLTNHRQGSSWHVIWLTNHRQVFNQSFIFRQKVLGHFPWKAGIFVITNWGILILSNFIRTSKNRSWLCVCLIVGVSVTMAPLQLRLIWFLKPARQKSLKHPSSFCLPLRRVFFVSKEICTINIAAGVYFWKMLTISKEAVKMLNFCWLPFLPPWAHLSSSFGSSYLLPTQQLVAYTYQCKEEKKGAWRGREVSLKRGTVRK